MSAFAKTHRVVAIDLAGHGESGKERKDWTMPPEQIEALARRKT
jgi:pimeloyl-ACP methyl ester carboxylesterase